jgi:hypothetical protein
MHKFNGLVGLGILLVSIGGMYGMWLLDSNVFNALVSSTSIGGVVAFTIIFILCLIVSLIIFIFGIIGAVLGLAVGTS